METKEAAKLSEQEQEMALLAHFQTLHDYAERKEYFEAHPFLARFYCAGNFSADVPAKPATKTPKK